jgi:excisionase family DNA binding protein
MSTPTVSHETRELIEVAIKAAFEKAQATMDASIAAALAKAPISGSAPRLLTVSQAMAYLNCSRATLYRFEQSGVLIPKRAGRKVLYEGSELDALIASWGGQPMCEG